MATDLHDLSIAELAELIKARTLSPVELTEALIQRVERFDAQTRAFITPTFDLARRQARAAGPGPPATSGDWPNPRWSTVRQRYSSANTGTCCHQLR